MTNTPQQPDAAGSSERRKLERHEVAGHIEVVDRLTGQILGRLVDIHSEGLMMITSSLVDVGNIYQLNLQHSDNGNIWLQVGVDCLWKNSANGEDRYWVGFRVIDANDEALAELAGLGMDID